MKKLDLHIQGFKCFDDEHFELNALTLLTGANGAGKSTVIQALLLMKQAWENRRSGDAMSSARLNVPEYAMELGTIADVLRVTGNVLFGMEDFEFNYVYKDDVPDDQMEFQISEGKFVPEIRYLCAERQGPRYQSPIFPDIQDGCGCDGSHVASVINKELRKKIDKKRFFDEKNEGNFQVQLNRWIDYLFPCLGIRVVMAGENNYQVKVMNSIAQKESPATNIGFGISYALPILVEGLLVEPGTFLVVENPEAHLHAKSQSNMGYFLGKMASAGVRLLVETHSEHIVNGVRRAIVDKSLPLSSEDVNIYYLNQNEPVQKCRKITVDQEGNLSDFPEDFFDQVQQDLLEIIRMADGQ